MKLLKDNNIDGLILKSNANIFYTAKIDLNAYELEGFALLTENEVHIVTDGRYEVEAKLLTAENPNTKVHIIKNQNYYELLKDVINSLGLNRVGFEENWLTISDYNQLNNSDFELVATNNLVEELREVKTEAEQAIIREGYEVTNRLWDHIKSFVVAGKKESEVVLEMNNFILSNGGTGFSFDPIIASGENSTKPHAGWTDKVIENGDTVTLDFGIMYKHYATDVTKNIVVGDVNPQIKEMHALCVEANTIATNLIKEGADIAEVDKLSRKVIEDAGYGEFYNHSLGHGVGLLIHESPRLSAKAGGLFKAGQVVTIEPGIYIPGVGGVRVESAGIVTKDGIEILTNSRKLIEN